MKRVLAGLAMLAAASGAAKAQHVYARDVAPISISHDDQSRSAGVYVPASYDAARPAPLIVALHGRFSSAKAFHAQSRLAALAEARGAILLYPESAAPYWNDGGFAMLGRRVAEHDDAGLIQAAIVAVSGDYAVDAAQIYLVGYDTGGAMVYRLLCQEGARYAGAVIVSALMWDYAADACAGAGATPLLIVHGREDESYPVRGARPDGPVTARRLGVDETLEVWRRRNGCSGRGVSGRNGGVLYTSCAAPLAYVGVGRGGHGWFRDGEGYRLNLHGVDAARLAESFLFAPESFALPEARHRGGRARDFFVYAPPSYDPSTPMPAVIMLHGRPSNATAMATITQMNLAAARNGFIVIYPEGLGNEWNAIHDITGRRSVAPQDDVGFLEELIADLSVVLNIDSRRTYIAGFSNGGFMTMRMACSSSRFAAYASVGAAMYTQLRSECRSGRRAPILIMHGTADPSVPYTGVVVADGMGREPTQVTLSVMDTVRFFFDRNNCTPAGQSTAFAESGRSPGTHVIRFVPNRCEAGQVVFYLINGGGHTWPGVPGVLPEALGPVNMDVDAGQAIWDFFATQSLPEPPPPLR